MTLNEKTTRIWATIKELEKAGIDLNGDYFQLSISDASLVAEKATYCGYRKTSHAKGSLGRAFFAYLGKFIGKD